MKKMIKEIILQASVTPVLGVLLFTSAVSAAEAVTLTEVEKAQGWTALFDGKSFAGWRNYNGKGVRDGWKVIDGVIQHSKGGGDLITEKQYEDYELTLEWKIGENGNSGILLGAQETTAPIYTTAIEMQVFGNKKDAKGTTVAGACYGLYEPPSGVVGEVGTWNKVHVVKQGDHYRFYLNGVKTADFKTHGDDFKKRVAESKFVKWPYFARHSKGHIGLQDHGNAVSYRNIKLRELTPVSLFNRKDIKNWDYFLKEDKPAGQTWSIDQGVLRCTGKPIGYLISKKDYRDYQIDVEWRWIPGKKTGNNGLLVHAIPGTKSVDIWPKSLEVQLLDGHAGDFWLIGQDIKSTDLKARKKGRNIKKLVEGLEKPHGEWNLMRTICRGGEVTVFVNGQLINYGFNSTAQQGRICLQSEGAPIEYRKVELTPLPGL